MIPCPNCRWTAKTAEGMARHLSANHPIGAAPSEDDVSALLERRTPVTTPARTVRVYVRVSSDDQTCENQLARIEPAISLKGWTTTHVEVYRDDGLSGATTDRPELRRLMTDLRPGDVVCIQRADRLSRATRDFIELTTAIQRRGAELFCTDQPIDTTHPIGMAFWQILGVFAQLELALIVQRTNDSMARLRRTCLCSHRVDAHQGATRKEHTYRKRGKVRTTETFRAGPCTLPGCNCKGFIPLRTGGPHPRGCGYAYPCPWGFDHQARDARRNADARNRPPAGTGGPETSVPATGNPPPADE